jgi:hypothetical protein
MSLNTDNAPALDLEVISKIRLFFTSNFYHDTATSITPTVDAHSQLQLAYQQLYICLHLLLRRVSALSTLPLSVDELMTEYDYDTDNTPHDTMQSRDILYCCYTLLFFVRNALTGEYLIRHRID